MQFLQGKSKWMTFLGSFLVSIGVLLLSTRTILYNGILTIATTLTPHNPVVDIWRVNPMPLALDFYFFNWTNPEDINDPTIKPKFQELGPYRYIETKEKVNLTWHNNDTLSYRQLRWWYFDKKSSPYHIDDKITTINAVALSAAHLVNKWSYFTQKSFSFSLKSMVPHLHITRTVRELLFEGFDDPLVTLGKTMPFLTSYMPPFDKFGWFYTRNGSYTFDGHFNMATGANRDFGVLKNWNYQNSTPYFDGDCAKIHGSAGELYTSNKKRDRIGFFSPDMCRHLLLDYEEDVTVKGIPGYKYTGQHGLLDNGTLISENKCYCNGDCVPSGLMNVSSCRYGTPSFVSLPHFYNADPFYINQVEGLNPQKDKHEMYITLEPKTGIPLAVAARLQLNLYLYPMKNIGLFESVRETYFPVLWFQQTVQIPDYLIVLVELFLYVPHILIIVGVAITILGCICLYYAIYKYPAKFTEKHKKKLGKESIPLKHASYTPIEVIK